MATAMVPKIYDPKLAMKTRHRTEMPTRWPSGWRGKKDCSWHLGRGCGGGSVKVAETRKQRQPAVIVTILCDSGDKYLSERFWDEA